MRPVPLFAVVVAAITACTAGDRPTRVPSASAGGGPDAILLRLPRGGGTARAFRWGTDSALWTSSTRIPALDRILGFDDDQGSLAYVDARGVPGRLDLRLGTTEPAAPVSLAGLATADGWAIYGLTPKRDVSRLTPSGTWTFTPDRPSPRTLIPVSDGSLVLASDDGRRMSLRRLRPPEARVTDTASVPSAELVVRTEIGDRIYFLGDSGLAGVRVRDLARTKTIRLPAHAADAAVTPSGDRVYVALRGRKSIAAIDRYAEEIERTIDLPREASALRMDPDGRYLLARSSTGDSVYVVSIAARRVTGTVASSWRADLPLVGPDGALALVQHGDVVLVDAEGGKERMRFRGGADDSWMLIRWNGFRPRAAGLDEPVRFADDSAATQAAIDSNLVAKVAGADTTIASIARAPDSVARAPDKPDTRRGTAPKAQFTLSFAAMLSEERANTMAAAIRVDGKPVRVVPSSREGTPIYRIVFGPFNSREDADRAGRRSGLPYWVYEGAP